MFEPTLDCECVAYKLLSCYPSPGHWLPNSLIYSVSFQLLLVALLPLPVFTSLSLPFTYPYTRWLLFLSLLSLPLPKSALCSPLSLLCAFSHCLSILVSPLLLPRASKRLWSGRGRRCRSMLSLWCWGIWWRSKGETASQLTFEWSPPADAR